MGRESHVSKFGWVEESRSDGRCLLLCFFANYQHLSSLRDFMTRCFAYLHLQTKFLSTPVPAYDSNRQPLLTLAEPGVLCY